MPRENIHYVYYDEKNEPINRVVRTPEKAFYQERWDYNVGRWERGISGVRKIPYNLNLISITGPEDTIYIVEGEKDADRLVSLGLVATTNHGGSCNWKPELNQYFVGREIVIIPDNDEPGRKHAEHVACQLYDNALSLKVISLPGLSEKGDISDWFDLGYKLDDFLLLIPSQSNWIRPPLQKSQTSSLTYLPRALPEKKMNCLLVAQRLTSLHERHDGWWGICPYHQENTPSFKVFLDQRGFFCFGCRKKGDAIDLLMLETGKTFIDVVKEYQPERLKKHQPEIIQAGREIINAWVAYFNAIDSIKPLKKKSQRYTQMMIHLDSIRDRLLGALFYGMAFADFPSIPSLGMGILYRSCPEKIRAIIANTLEEQVEEVTRIMHEI